MTGYITLGYRGTFGFGKDGLSDVKFRKLSRLIVSGKVALCREVCHILIQAVICHHSCFPGNPACTCILPHPNNRGYLFYLPIPSLKELKVAF